MFAIFGSIASFLAGIVTLVQSFVNQYDRDQQVKAGVLQEQAREQATKAHDEAIANQVDALPTPGSKRTILDRM